MYIYTLSCTKKRDEIVQLGRRARGRRPGNEATDFAVSEYRHNYWASGRDSTPQRNFESMMSLVYDISTLTAYYYGPLAAKVMVNRFTHNS